MDIVGTKLASLNDAWQIGKLRSYLYNLGYGEKQFPSTVGDKRVWRGQGGTPHEEVLDPPTEGESVPLTEEEVVSEIEKGVPVTEVEGVVTAEPALEVGIEEIAGAAGMDVAAIAEVSQVPLSSSLLFALVARAGRHREERSLERRDFTGAGPADLLWPLPEGESWIPGSLGEPAWTKLVPEVVEEGGTITEIEGGATLVAEEATAFAEAEGALSLLGGPVGWAIGGVLGIGAIIGAAIGISKSSGKRDVTDSRALIHWHHANFTKADMSVLNGMVIHQKQGDRAVFRNGDFVVRGKMTEGGSTHGYRHGNVSFPTTRDGLPYVENGHWIAVDMREDSEADDDTAGAFDGLYNVVGKAHEESLHMLEMLEVIASKYAQAHSE